MKNYRPDGWDNPYVADGNFGRKSLLSDPYDAFEAGADALLKAIRDELGKAWNDYEGLIILKGILEAKE